MMHLLAPVIVALASFALALNPVLVKGNVFYDSVTNQRLFLIGVDYQPGGEQGIDPLVDPEICARDVFLLQKLGANVLRVYTVDNSLNHDECMSMYNAAGIYLLLDVNSAKEGQHLNRLEPWTTYNSIYAKHVFSTIQVFSGYDNVIGFFSGNELINDPVTAMASPPYIKAITRDIKSFISKHLHRPFAIGYSAADNIEFRVETASYMSCGDADSGINDFYAINSYQWCGSQTLTTSGYDTLLQQLSNMTIPVIFSEIGCRQVRPRKFSEIGAIYSAPMTSVFSGAIVYEYSEEANDYGLVRLGPGKSARQLPDYDALESQFAKIENLPVAVPVHARPHPKCPDPSTFKSINGSSSILSLPEIERVIEQGVGATPGKLRDVILRPTTLSIKDSAGREVLDKTPVKRSGIGKGIDLSPLLKGDYAPTGNGSSKDSGDGRISSSPNEGKPGKKSQDGNNANEGGSMSTKEGGDKNDGRRLELGPLMTRIILVSAGLLLA